MTNPNPDHSWNPNDLPVLTEVVDAGAIPVLEIPAYDFSAELDALADALPENAPPGITLPPELTLDDVLGDDLGENEQASLSATQLIERLPSLDLEVDLPAELSLDDVLPGLDAHLVPSPSAELATVDDFAFELDDVPASAHPATEGNGLGALFARATFEPVVLAATPQVPFDDSPLQADQASLDQFAAQLDGFDEPQDMPELPLDAFLSKAAEGAEPQAEIFSAESTDDEWAGTWEPPVAPAAGLAVPVLHDTLAQAVAPALPVRLGAQDALPELAADVIAGQSTSLAEAAPSQPLATLSVDAASGVLPKDEPGQSVAEPLSTAGLALSVEDILAGLQPLAQAASSDVVTGEDSIGAGWVTAPVATAESTVSLADPPLPEPAAQPAVLHDVPHEALLVAAPVAHEPAANPEPEPLMASAEPDAAIATLAAPFFPTGEPAAAPAATPASMSPAVPAAGVVQPALAPVVPHTISLDSLPTGVLGGGLGLAAAALSTAALLGEPAAKLPGGDWPQTAGGFHAGDKEVELAWARDLGAEPPLDLDHLPAASEAAAPVIAEVIRVRRTAPASLVMDPAPATPLHVSDPAEAIHIEAVSEAMPQATIAAAPTVPVGLGLDEDALIDALYARVLPRMKVELTLWMQDALEQQAKQLMAGVMKQLKEDFDMMLAESLRASLREALDDAANPKRDKE
jgi:hypothetical protein